MSDTTALEAIQASEIESLRAEVARLTAERDALLGQLATIHGVLPSVVEWATRTLPPPASAPMVRHHGQTQAVEMVRR